MGIFSRGDVVGGDKAGGDIVHGDKVAGNKGDTITAQNSVGVGKGINVAGDINQQISGALDLQALAGELQTLRNEMLANVGSDPEKIIAVGEIVKAEQAAAAGDEPKALEYLSKAGKWALEAAKSIAVPVAVEALKRAMMP